MGTVEFRFSHVGSALIGPLGYWQSIQLYSGYSAFYEMCDTVQGAIGNFSAPNATYSANGVGLPKALDNYANWWSTNYLPGSK